MSGLNSPYMQAIRRPDDTHEGRPVFDVISRRQRIVLANRAEHPVALTARAKTLAPGGLPVPFMYFRALS